MKSFDTRVEYPWIADRGDGTFCNPILCADYSDPDVIRDGDDFYMVASSFVCTPGLPILHSRDLVNWTIVNHALRNLPHSRYDRVLPGCGVWAPAIRKHAGLFWIFFPMVDEGIFVTTARDPAGEWSSPHLVQEGAGLIDPCPLWDDDGKAYLVHAYANSRTGFKHKIRVRPMAPDGSRLLGEGQIVFDDPQRHPTAEGPKFLKKDGYYYILAPAGGVRTGWQLVLRSPNVFGPYEEKVVLEQGSTPINGPHQGGLEMTASGQWWFVHFQEMKPYGRIIHLQPVTWKDGWPLMGVDHDGNGIGEPVAAYAKPDAGAHDPPTAPQTNDEFERSRLGLQWQWQANHQSNWHSLTARPGWMRLFSQPIENGDFSAAANLLLQKFPARSFSVQTRLEFSPRNESELAGLIVMGLEHAALAVRGSGGGEVIWILNGVQTPIGRLGDGPVDFRVEVADGGYCRFSYRVAEGPFQFACGFQSKEGVWIGAKVGIFSVDCGPGKPSGHADFDFLRFGPPGRV